MKSDNIWLKRLIESVAKRDRLEVLAAPSISFFGGGGWNMARRIEINQLPPAECSPNYRGHWTERHRAARIYNSAVFYQCIDVKNRMLEHCEVKPIKVARIDLTFVCDRERVRDRDNFIARFKPGLDALVRAGVIEADDAKHLHIGNVNIEVDRDRAPLTIIELSNSE